MNINILIADELYQQMKSEGKRIRGSIGLITDNSADFNRHSNARTKPLAMLKLPHGCASIRKDSVRLNLYTNPAQEQKLPSKIMEEESRQAVDFFFSYDLQDLSRVAKKAMDRSKAAGKRPPRRPDLEMEPAR